MEEASEKLVTYFRIITGPIIFILILGLQFYGVALIILMLASATDWFGWLSCSSHGLAD